MQTSPANLPRHKRALLEFIHSLPQDARVLDIGCGSGKAIQLLHSERPDISILGMDIADVRELMPPYLEFKQGTVDDLATFYPPDSFDAVICQHVIEHLVNPVPMIEGIRTILKKGGRLYIETPNWTRTFVPFSHLYFWGDYTHIHPYSVITMYRMFFDFNMSARVWTISSCSWFPKQSHLAKPEMQKVGRVLYDGRGFASRAFARLVNPLLRDILIAVAEK